MLYMVGLAGMHAAVSFFLSSFGLRSKKGDSFVVRSLLIARGYLAVIYDSCFILARCHEKARSFLTHTEKKRAQAHVPREIFHLCWSGRSGTCACASVRHGQ
jgi:hypothetical protein